MATTQFPKFDTKNDLAVDTRDQMIDMLNQHLADSFDLYSQTKQAHWNVKGMNFIALHELFDQLAEGVLEYVDMIAERATALGGYAAGTARMAAENSQLPAFPQGDVLDGRNMVKAIVERYSAFGEAARQAIDTADKAGDQATADLYTEIVRGVDKNLYFLEAHLQ